MDEDRFNLRLFISQADSAIDLRIIREYTINPHIGLSKKVEFVGWLPVFYIQDPSVPDQKMTTMGDILGELKFELKKFWYRLPLIQKNSDTLSYLNLYLGFNFATGPGKEFAEGFFYPYSIGIGDFRWGFLWGSYTKKWEYFLNFIYTYAAQKGETFFPVSSKIFYFPEKKPNETKEEREKRIRDTVFLWNIHRVFLKFFWPGPSYGEWPMRDDFIVYSFNFSWWIEDFPFLFRHKLMLEIVGLQSFNQNYCLRLNQIDLTFAIMTRFLKSIKSFLGVSLPLKEGLYSGPRFFVGVMFSL